MSFKKAANAADLPPGEAMEANVAGRRIALCNANGRIYAISGDCPHLGASLGQGTLRGTKLVCPWHAWEFDCRTGEYDRNPELRLEQFEVKVEGGEIFVKVK